MAIGDLKGGNGAFTGGFVHTASVRGQWQQVNDDLETAEAAADLLKPWNITRSTFHWCKVPEWATRVLVRGKIDLASTTYTTAPVVRLVGAFPFDLSTNGLDTIRKSGFSGVATDVNGAEFLRLDAATANATGPTIPIAASKTTMFIDSTGYIYTDPIDLTGYDVKGAWYVGLMVETAAVVTGGASNGVFGELLFLN